MSRRFVHFLIAFAVLAGSTFALAQRKETSGRAENRAGQRAEKRAERPAGVPVNASSSTNSSAGMRKRNRDRKPMALTSSRKAAALEFAKRHHPELFDLLQGLEKRNRNAYVRAMRQLYQTSERLARAKERFSPERFEMELDGWKLDSRIRLLAARLEVSPKKDPKLQKELNDALLERIDVRVRQMRKEKARLAQRLNNLDQTIDMIEADREKAATQHLNRIRRGLGLKNRRPRAKQRAMKRKAAQRKRSESTRPKPNSERNK